MDTLIKILLTIVLSPLMIIGAIILGISLCVITIIDAFVEMIEALWNKVYIER